MRFEKLEEYLNTFHQGHVLKFWDALSPASQTKLADQIDQLDLSKLRSLILEDDETTDFADLAKRAEPPPAVGADGSGVEWSIDQATELGQQALQEGKLGALLVAGGQGTRLGFDKPKGMFPVGPVSNRTLFQFFADQLIAVAETYGSSVPLYVMTSEATDAETRAYFEANDFLGLSPENVFIFQQGTMPAVDQKSGSLLMSQKDSLALSPDGHGGTVDGLERSGALEDAKKRGIENLFYFQVDNPLVQLLDPTLIGHHLLAKSELTTQVVRKRFPTERVGNVVTVDGRVQIIEYSDLPDEAANAMNSDGTLRLWAGNIAVHLFDVGFLGRISQSTEALPYHRASKKVPYLDEEGNRVLPAEPNAVKFEKFIFDLLPQAQNGFVVEAHASEAFAPVKNADGAEFDTPQLAKQAISALHRKWLQSAGATVHEGIQVEISPRFALTKEQLAKKISRGMNISRDVYFQDEAVATE